MLEVMGLNLNTLQFFKWLSTKLMRKLHLHKFVRLAAFIKKKPKQNDKNLF